MTTTLCVNAHNMQVSGEHQGRGERAQCASLEQQVRVVPANNRQRDGEASIRSAEEQDRSRHRSAHRGAGLELSTGTGLYCECRSIQCCLAVWSRCAESSTRLGGFRALKKTTEAPYTTKVNYRGRTTRGTTHHTLEFSTLGPFFLSVALVVSVGASSVSSVKLFPETLRTRMNHDLVATWCAWCASDQPCNCGGVSRAGAGFPGVRV